MKHLLSDKQHRLIAYCSEEVYRQRDDPRYVAFLVNAFAAAWDHQQKGGVLTTDFVQQIGAQVSPDKNTWGYRKVGVRVGLHVMPEASTVPSSIVTLCEAWNEGRIDGRNHPLAGPVSAEAVLYYEFLQIHPFLDGNGRSSKVIYNLVCGTLDDPIWPPDFFGGILNP